VQIEAEMKSAILLYSTRRAFVFVVFLVANLAQMIIVASVSVVVVVIVVLIVCVICITSIWLSCGLRRLRYSI
jgi:hypothetical protein